MSASELEQALRSFEKIATPIERRADGQTWKFEWNGREYLLYFYKRARFLNRAMRGNPAHRHFFGLRTLQNLAIPSPHAVAQLAGFRLAGETGDAVMVESAASDIAFEKFLIDHELCGEPIPNRRSLAEQLCSIVHQLGQAGLGHSNLSLSSFLVRDGRVLLGDAQFIHGRGLRMKEVMRLGHSAARIATLGEMRRTWQLLQPGASMPRRNPLSPRIWNQIIRSITEENESFGILRSGQWSGVFTRQSSFAGRTSPASQLHITHEDWQRAWPELLRHVQNDQQPRLKSDSSGEVLSAEVQLAGRKIVVIIKRPKNKFWYRYLLDLFRASRAARTWTKTWKVIIRGLPTEWPMLLMEKRSLGYVTDAVVVFEEVDGITLDRMDLDSLSPSDRQTLFRRAGRSLRILERTGLSHMDAKSTNWMVQRDPRRGPVPVMIDLFGIRGMNFTRFGFGVRRLLRAMRQHPQYTKSDSLELCLGYTPYSRIALEAEAVNLS